MLCYIVHILGLVLTGQLSEQLQCCLTVRPYCLYSVFFCYCWLWANIWWWRWWWWCRLLYVISYVPWCSGAQYCMHSFSEWCVLECP